MHAIILHTGNNYTTLLSNKAVTNITFGVCFKVVIINVYLSYIGITACDSVVLV